MLLTPENGHSYLRSQYNVQATIGYYDNYPRESEAICIHRRWFVCVCVCVSVCL